MCGVMIVVQRLCHVQFRRVPVLFSLLHRAQLVFFFSISHPKRKFSTRAQCGSSWHSMSVISLSILISLLQKYSHFCYLNDTESIGAKKPSPMCLDHKPHSLFSPQELCPNYALKNPSSLSEMPLFLRLERQSNFVTIPSSHVQFTLLLLLLLEQHAANACSSFLYHSSCITRMLHASDACFSSMPLPLC